MSAMKAIHVMRRDLGLDEPTYRAVLVRVTGKDSLRAMTPAEQNLVAADLRAKGGDKRKAVLPGQYGPKLQALWLSGWNLGLIRNPANEALLAFVKGQTGIDHTRFLRNAADALKAVEALKSWLSRAGGVDWVAYEDPQDCVIAAQRRLLGASPTETVMTINGTPGKATAEALLVAGKVALMQVLGEQIRALPKAVA